MCRRKKNQIQESSEEDEDSIPAIHSLKTPISKESEARKTESAMRRRMRERKKKCEKETPGKWFINIFSSFVNKC